MNEYPICILGGGVAGLAASIQSGGAVFEAADCVGGVAMSDSEQGFTFDRGIHILQTQNEALMGFFSDLGLMFRLHRRRAFIYAHKTYFPYPFQVNTSHLPVFLRVRCVWQFLKRDQDIKKRNYEDWIYASIGKGLADTFLIPYSDKFWTVHPREMTYEWAGNRVPQPTAAQVIRGALWSKATKIGTNSEFRYPVGPKGYGEVAEALLRRAGPVRLGHRAIRIDPHKRQIEFSNGACISYGSLISTIPLPELIQICENAPAAVKTAASRLRANSIFVVNLGINRPGISDKHWVHFPERDVSFFRISYPHNFGPDVAPPGTSSVSAEVSYSDERPIDKSTIVDRVIEDLIRVRAIGKHDQIIMKATYDIPYAYCIYDMHRTEALRTVHEWLRQVEITPSGRYGLWTYFWSDEAILSGRKSGETLLKKDAKIA